MSASETPEVRQPGPADDLPHGPKFPVVGVGALREYLQSVIEEQESTNEELKSANSRPKRQRPARVRGQKVRP